MGFLVLLFVFLSGLPIFTIFNKKNSMVNPFPYCFVFGSSVSIPFLYFTTALITKNLQLTIISWIIVVALFSAIAAKLFRIRLSLKSFLIFTTLTLFCFYFFQRSFYYKNNTFFIASNLYSDLTLHLSTIRSFSLGENFPFELPYFGGKSISYHFFYDFYTGILEFSGIRIDIAYNLLFSLIFVSIFFVCLDVGKIIFKQTWIGFLAFLFLIFSPDLSFINVLYKYRDNMLSLWSINSYYLDSYLGNHTIGNFLYFNTFLNQRHLLFSLVLSLSIFVSIWKCLTSTSNSGSRIKVILAGILIGLMPYWNFPTFLCLSFLVGLLFLINRKYNLLFILCFFIFVLSFPQIISLQNGLRNQIKFEPGFLTSDSFSLVGVSIFWVLNLGMAIVSIIGGFVIGDKYKKTLFLSLLPIFILPNLFKFSTGMFNNHKFFNFWFIFMAFYSASFILFLITKNKPYKVLGVIIFLASILSGAINLLVIKNDILAPIPDYSRFKLASYVNSGIPKKEIIVTNGETYDPISISGRKTYLGRANDIFLYGANPDKRTLLQNKLFTSANKNVFSELKNEKINYIIIYKDKSVKNLKPVNLIKLDSLTNKIYEDDFGIIYKIH